MMSKNKKASPYHVCGFLRFSDKEFLLAGMTAEQRDSLTDDKVAELNKLALAEFGNYKGRRQYDSAGLRLQ